MTSVLLGMSMPISRSDPKDHPDLLVARVAALQHGVFSRNQAVACGMTPNAIQYRLKIGRWERVLPAVYRLAGAVASWHQRLMGACLWAGREAVVSHRAAAALWGLDGCLQTRTIEVRACRWPSPSVPDVVVHPRVTLDASDVAKRERIPVTSVHRTLIDLPAVAQRDVVEAALESALRNGLTSIAYLRRRLDSVGGRGRRGCGTLRKLLDERNPPVRPTDSTLETRMEQLARRFGLPSLTRGHEVFVDRKFIARLDFAYPELLIDIEIDSQAWHYTKDAWHSDRARDTALRALGWIVLRFTWREVRSRPGWVVAQIRTAMATRRFT